ncbi:endonuclease/exonuclease/phosphatase family protein [Longimicrobium sp.]|uniref:endonuclease/exonuclease/phosphatase family protein n=1 Tax=Longimicrobium sp. TaxID=2029185 RepID=UPI003B3A7D63
MTFYTRIPWRAAAAALALSLFTPAPAAAQPSSIDTRPFHEREVVLDGFPWEWDATPSAALARRGGGHHHHGGVPREPEPPPPWPMPNSVRVRHDADAVYLLLRLEHEVSLQSMPGTLVLLMDADGDPASGWAAHGMPGVDAALEFSPVWPDGARAGAGLRIRAPGQDSTSLVPANEAGLIVAPSHASTFFEMRIRRGGPVPFGARMTARLLSLDANGAVADSLPAFTVQLADPAPRPVTRGAGEADPLARHPAVEFRVVSWNVGRETMFQQPEAYGAILRPLAPDVLLLDEVAGGHSAEEVEALLNRILPGDVPWRALYGTSGGTQRGVIAARGTLPVVAAPFATTVPYPDSVLALLPADASPRAREAMERRMADGVPVLGAIVQIAGKRLLAVTVDLECCGGAGTPSDRLRRIEALAVRQATEAALRAGGVDGLLITGDLNLVGSEEPRTVLMREMDVDDRWLWAAQPRRLDGVSEATWEWAGDRFTPSRLDYVLYSQATLGWVGGFVFRSADLSARWQAAHGVADDTSRATDHLPVVSDFRWGPGS